MTETGPRPNRVGIVGGGSIVIDHHLPLLRAAGVDVVWVADPSPSARQLCKWRFGVDSIVPERAWESLDAVDVVLLAIPVGVRDEPHHHLASSGVTVYLEKPIARSSAELDHLIEAYGDSRVVCGFQRRSLAGKAAISRFLDERPLGEIRRVTLHEGARTRATGSSQGFRDDRALSGGGVLTDLGCHGLDLLDQTVGLTDAVIERQDLWIDDGIDRDVSLTLRANGIEVDIRLSWASDIENEFAIECEDGILTTAPRLTGPVDLQPGPIGWATDPRPPGSVNMTQGFWDVWASALRRPSTIADYSLDSARAVVQLTERIYRDAGLLP